MIFWIASYPRSGNTFFRTILKHCFGINTYSIYNDIHDIAADKKTAEIVGHQILSHDFNINTARNDSENYFIKTHSHWEEDMINDKVIYLVRDGRESIVSYRNYLNNYFHKNIELSSLISGNSFVGSWSEHINSWKPNFRKHTLLLKFEILISDYKQYLKPISDFIETEIKNSLVPSFEDLHSLNPKFFYSGRTDSWTEMFTKKEVDYFWFKNLDVMTEYGYIDDIPKFFNKSDNNDLLTAISIIANEIKNEKDKIINEKNIIIENKDNLLQQKLSEIKKKEILIQKLTYEIKENKNIFNKRENEIKKLNENILKSEKTIQKKEKLILEKEKLIQVLKTSLSETQKTLRDKVKENNLHKDEILHKEDNIQKLTEQLSKVYNARSLRLARWLTGTKNKI